MHVSRETWFIIEEKCTMYKPIKYLFSFYGYINNAHVIIMLYDNVDSLLNVRVPFVVLYLGLAKKCDQLVTP